MQFQNIAGADFPKRVLRTIVHSGRVPHALLFSGKTGCGQWALSLAFASYLNCQNKTPTDSCGQCSHCSKLSRWLHPDINFVLPVTTSPKYPTNKDAKTIHYLPAWYAFLEDNAYPTLGDWAKHFQADANKQCAISKEETAYIKQLVTTPPFVADRKCIFVWLPETMHPAASNAILKLLEEPSENIVFILVTDRIERLLPTIVSRTQIIQVPPFSQSDVKSTLNQHLSLAEEQMQSIAFLSQGNMNKAFKLASDSESELHLFPSYFKNWLRKCYTREYDELIKYAETFSRWSKEQQKQFIEFAIQWMREALMSICGQKDLMYLNEVDLSFIQKFAKAINPQGIQETIARWNSAFYEIDRNAHSKMLFLDISITAIESMSKSRKNPSASLKPHS